MTGKVLRFTGITSQDHQPEQILEMVMEQDLSEVVVIGTTSAGTFYFASSRSDAGDVLWLLERARHRLMQAVDDFQGQ